MKTFISFILCVTIIFLTSCLQWMQTTVERKEKKHFPEELEYTPSPGTFEEAAQNIFSDYMYSACSCIPKIKPASDYIPSRFRKIIDAPDFKLKVEKANKISLIGLFFYPLNSTEIMTPFDKITFSASNLILINDYFDYPIEGIPNSQFNNFLFSSTCGNYINGSLKSSARAPIGAISAALEADEQTQATLIGIGGNFISPLYSVLNSNNEIKTNTLGTLWDFYSRQSNPNEKFYFLKTFEGSAFKQTFKSENKVILETEGKLNVAVPTADLSATFKAGLQTSDFFKGTKWTTMINVNDNFINNRASYYSQLPTVDDIIKHFKNNVKRSNDNIAAQDMYQNTMHEHFVIFSGIPSFMKNNSDWTIEITSIDKIYQGNPILEIDRSYLPKTDCKFIIKGKPDNSLFTTLNENIVKFTYKLTYQKPISGNYLSLYVDNVELNTNAEPYILEKYVNVNTEFFPNAGTKKYKWRFDIQIQDKLNIINYTTPLPPNSVEEVVIKDIEINKLFSISGFMTPIAVNKKITVELNCDIPGAFTVGETQFIEATVKATLVIQGINTTRYFKVFLPIYKMT